MTVISDRQECLTYGQIECDVREMGSGSSWGTLFAVPEAACQAGQSHYANFLACESLVLSHRERWQEADNTNLLAAPPLSLLAAASSLPGGQY